MPQATARAPTQPVAAAPQKVISGPVSTPVAVPATRSDVVALQSRVSELKGQLDAATGRRDRLAQQLRHQDDQGDNHDGQHHQNHDVAHVFYNEVVHGWLPPVRLAVGWL